MPWAPNMSLPTIIMLTNQLLAEPTQMSWQGIPPLLSSAQTAVLTLYALSDCKLSCCTM